MIKLSNINKTYLGKDVQTVALKDIELDINKGEFVAVMGRSGCGKTTLLNILGCMDSPTQGRYSFNDEDMINRKASELAKFRNKHLGFIFQSFNLIDEMTAFENIEVPLGYAGMGRRERTERVNELLSMVGMTDRQQHRPAQLSGGQQQRVAIARALANNPELILADEPTGNLDSTNGNEIMELLKNLNDSGTTLILVTHDEVIAEYAHRRITLVDGRIESDVIK